jgi:hypothetical protein
MVERSPEGTGEGAAVLSAQERVRSAWPLATAKSGLDGSYCAIFVHDGSYSPSITGWHPSEAEAWEAAAAALFANALEGKS